jgi:hypothetical protein
MKVQVFDEEGTSHTYTFAGVGQDYTVHIANPSEWVWARNLFEIQFGAYGATHIAVWADNLSDAVDIAAEYAADRGWTGLVQPHDEVYAEVQEWVDAGDIGDSEEEMHEAIDENWHYTEAGYITAHEWHGHEASGGDYELAIEYGSIQHDWDGANDDTMGEALAKGIMSKNASVSSHFAKLMREMPDEVQVEADAAMGA